MLLHFGLELAMLSKYIFSSLTINAGDIWASKQITSQISLRWAGHCQVINRYTAGEHGRPVPF